MRKITNFLRLIYTIYVALIFIALLLMTVPFFLLFSLLLGDRSLPLSMVLCRFIAYALMLLCGIIYRFHRNPATDRKRTYVIVSNHRSNMDAPVAAVACWGNVRYLAKKELLKIPLLGQLFKTTTVIVDRSSPESRRKSIESLKEYLLKGDHIFIFPEGTRNKTKDRPLIDFKDGAFTIAIQSQAQILPMLFVGTDTIMPYQPFLLRPGFIDIYELDPVETTGLTDTDVSLLREKIRNTMVEKYVALTSFPPKKDA